GVGGYVVDEPGGVLRVEGGAFDGGDGVCGSVGGGGGCGDRDPARRNRDGHDGGGEGEKRKDVCGGPVSATAGWGAGGEGWGGGGGGGGGGGVWAGGLGLFHGDGDRCERGISDEEVVSAD